MRFTDQNRQGLYYSLNNDYSNVAFPANFSDEWTINNNNQKRENSPSL